MASQTITLLDRLADIYIVAYADDPEVSHSIYARDSFIERTRRQAESPGFKFVAAYVDNEMAGFSFGLPFAAGRWWRGEAHTPPPDDILSAEKFAVIELVRRNFAMPSGMIHGDSYRGNLLRDGTRVVLADWDSVSNGPREIDLIPTLQARRFGLPEKERDAFIAAYGYDVTTWPGFPTLRDIRELSTITALLRNAHTDPASLRELKKWIRSIRDGDDREWTTFCPISF